MQAFISRTR